MANEEVKVVGVSGGSVGGKKTNFKLLAAVLVLLVVTAGVIAGIFLVRQQQDIREDAAENVNMCPQAEACPDSDGALRNCRPAAPDGGPVTSFCNSENLGQVKFCGTRNYCCNGASWTTNMTACSGSTALDASPTASASPTATSTASSSASPTATSSAKASTTPTASSSATPFPVPETGIGTPAIIGILGGVVLLGAAFLFAF